MLDNCLFWVILSFLTKICIYMYHVFIHRWQFPETLERFTKQLPRPDCTAINFFCTHCDIRAVNYEVHEATWTRGKQNPRMSLMCVPLRTPLLSLFQFFGKQKTCMSRNIMQFFWGCFVNKHEFSEIQIFLQNVWSHWVHVPLTPHTDNWRVLSHMTRHSEYYDICIILISHYVSW
jgi:hypothetical protein